MPERNSEGVDDRFVDKLLALGIISVLDLEEVGTEPLVKELGVDKSLTGQIITAAADAAKKAAAENTDYAGGDL